MPPFPFPIFPNTFAVDRDKDGTTNFLDSGGPVRRENSSFVQSHYIPIFHVACGRVGGGCRTESQGVAKIPFQYFTAYVLSLLAGLGVVNTYAKQTALRRSSMLLGFRGGCETTSLVSTASDTEEAREQTAQAAAVGLTDYRTGHASPHAKSPCIRYRSSGQLPRRFAHNGAITQLPCHLDNAINIINDRNINFTLPLTSPFRFLLYFATVSRFFFSTFVSLRVCSVPSVLFLPFQVKIVIIPKGILQADNSDSMCY